MFKKKLLCVLVLMLFVQLASGKEMPNILFVAIDDFNDWGPSQLEGEPFDVATPNFDELALNGIRFNNAHCNAPSCNPSRISIMSGLHPSSTGVYGNANDWREMKAYDEILLLPEYFQKHGYMTLGGGKIYHANQGNEKSRKGFLSPRGWDQFFPSFEAQLPVQSMPEKRPGRGQGVFDWGGTGKPLEEMGDHKVVNWAIDQMQKKHEKPIFMAVGIYRPHMPWYIPDKFYDQYDDVEIKPPVNPENWEQGIPAALTWRRRLKEFVGQPGPSRGYAAAMTYADFELGRLMDGLKESLIADNTIVVVWSDHGWHLGEKEHFSKFTLWEESTRVPLVLLLPDKTRKAVDTAVSLLDVYPTLVALAGLPANEDNEGSNLMPMVHAETDLHRAIVTSSGGGSHAVRDGRYRYITRGSVYALFDHASDPREFHDIADKPASAEVVKRLEGELDAWLTRGVVVGKNE